MKKQELGRFYATTFNKNTFEFIVYNNKTIDIPKLNINIINRIIIKPRFVLIGKEFIYEYKAKDLVENYNIDEELFNYLKQNQMIKYSNDMAYLYNFKDKNGYDSNPRYYGVGSPYKWAKKKGPILTKQKKGQFN